MRRFLPECGVENILVATSRECAPIVSCQMAAVDPKLRAQLVIEPIAKNTAAAIALGLRYLQEKRGISLDEPVLVCPSDHLIAPKERFLEVVQSALEAALEGSIVTFGIRPTRPETGYGYIRANQQKLAPYPIEAFIEKPPLIQAAAYLESGSYFWNAGMFLLQGKTFWRECKKHSAAIATLEQLSLAQIEAVFETLPSVSIDHALMEKTEAARVMPMDLSWSDVGSWDSVHEIMEKDPMGNAFQGSIQATDTKNSLVIGGRRLIATLGIEDLMIIDTEDALFVAKKGQSQLVKILVAKFAAQGRPETLEHKKVDRPWGSYTVLEEESRYKIKRISVRPGERLSLQLHYHRSEHWVVVTGTARVTIGDKIEIVHENGSIYVPKSAMHRLENPGKVPLEMIEVQVGEYVGEDDIVRFEDVYGRLS